MQEDQPVELPAFTVYYDVSVPNWLVLIAAAIVALLVIIAIVVVIYRKSNSGRDESR